MTVERLEQAILEKPAELQNYLHLADLHRRQDHLKEAEATLRRALAVSGSDFQVRERLEAIQIRRAQAQLAAAEQRAQKQPSTEASELVKRMKHDLNRLELAIYNSRSQRYPENLSLRYELGVRLKRAGNFKMAAECFREAQAETRLFASASIQEGECRQQIRQYPEALDCYLAARERLGEEPGELRKLALYRAGALAMGLRDWDHARQLLGELVQLDAAYRDAKSRLDKLSAIPNN